MKRCTFVILKMPYTFRMYLFGSFFMHISCLVLGFSYFVGLLSYTHQWMMDHPDSEQAQIVRNVLLGEDHLAPSSDTYDSSVCFMDLDATLVSIQADIVYYPLLSSSLTVFSRISLPVRERSSLFCRPPPVC